MAKKDNVQTKIFIKRSFNNWASLFHRDLTIVWEDYGVIILIFIPRETFNLQFKQEKNDNYVTSIIVLDVSIV